MPERDTAKGLMTGDNDEMTIIRAKTIIAMAIIAIVVRRRKRRRRRRGGSPSAAHNDGFCQFL